MDIKLKNKFIYILTFVIGVYLLSLSALTGYDLIKNQKYLVKDYYFKSPHFDEELLNYSRNILAFHKDLKNYDKKSYKEKIINKNMIYKKSDYTLKLKEKSTQIESEYEAKINKAQNEGNIAEYEKLILEKNKRIEDLSKLTPFKEDDIKDQVIKDTDKYYNNLKTCLNKKNYIKYYIKDLSNNSTYTNLKESPNENINIKKYTNSPNLYVIKLPYNDGNKYLEAINALFKNYNYEGYFMVLKHSSEYNPLINNYKYYNSIRNRLIKEILLCTFSLIMGLFIVIKIKKPNNLNKPFKIIKLYDCMSLDLKIFMFVIYTAIMAIYITNISFFYKPLEIQHFLKLSIISIYIFYFVYNLKYILVLKNNRGLLSTQCNNTLINKMKYKFVNKSIKYKIIFILLLSGMIGILLLLSLVSGIHGILIAPIGGIIYLSLLLIYLFKKADYLNEIIEATEEMTKGNLNYIITKNDTGVLGKLALNINNIKEGYKKSVEDQVKSERLKSELITNVSHDLKTPLTSIINYVNLLKNNNLDKDEFNSYIAILDRKSERLKHLIEDLFEASKMSSGSIKLNIEKVDVTALLKQALAELDEKLKKAFLEVKFNYSNNNIYTNLDGKKTWRVFENLLNNIIKYSQPNTRVYIDLIEDNRKVIITMKNISSYEMNFDAEEIFERFKRGDTSRNTEGSGLGLAISKSIVELEGGTLSIKIDGDLFKVIIEFNKN
ncbi:sensor histidine kinase [Clostridium niameyense]|uniref:sensor histidine kinase n=1 Tax=Clostridium niameyense TaxID=1622073 RepID=UPI00067E8270|nr:sensor histidine kinase [Clostridium niameyense]